MIPLKLSETKPDFESLLLQLQLYLSNTDTWIDLQTSGTGETLIEMMAAVGTFNQFAIESAAREAFLMAVRDSSIYAITRMLGVRIHRKFPAGVDVLLNRQNVNTSYAVPKFTQFTVNGKPFFNRNVLMFSQGSDQASQRVYLGAFKEVVDQSTFRFDKSAINVSQFRVGDEFLMLVGSGTHSGTMKRIQFVGGNVGDDRFALAAGEQPFTNILTTDRVSLLEEGARLYEGTITEESFVSDGTSFKQIYLSEGNFAVSDVDVTVSVINPSFNTEEAWKSIEDGLWIADAGNRVYYDSTSGLGEAILAFGDGLHGDIPLLGSTIKAKYAKTTGAAGNNGLTNLDVACTSLPELSGKTTSVISGGADEKPASYYRFMAPMIFKARNRAVTGPDYKAVSLDYPGIVSASVQTQKDVAPYDLRWMNQVQLCLLPIDESVDKPTTSEWDEFRAYMKKKRHAAVNDIHKDPTRLNATVEITLALKAQYIPSSVLPKAEESIRALFKRRPDTLGRRITLSDVTQASMVEGVDYVDVNICKLDSSSVDVQDLIPDGDTFFIALDEVTINTKYSERSIYFDGSNT